MGPWESAPEEVIEEEIDIFAELGAVRPSAPQAQPQQVQSNAAHSDPLAMFMDDDDDDQPLICLLYTSPSPRDRSLSRMPSSA